MGGYLLNLATAPHDYWIAAYGAIVLFLLAVSSSSLSWNMLIGFIFGMAFFLPHLQWVDFTVGKIPWFALTAAQSLFFVLLVLAWFFIQKIPRISNSVLFSGISFATLWVSVEHFRGVWPYGGFPWVKLAYTQIEAPLVRLAYLGGVPLVTFAVIISSYFMCAALLRIFSGQLVGFGAWALSACAIMGLGFLVPLPSHGNVGTIKVGLVQGNLADEGLSSFEHRREVLNNHLKGTHALLDQVAKGELDVVLWPENATDIDPATDESVAQDITAASQALAAPIVVGAIEYPESGGRYNVSLLWDQDNGVVDRYAKQHPVPFAEYIPNRDFFARFSSAVDLVQTQMLPGKINNPLVLKTDATKSGKAKLGTLICFEVASDELIHASVQNGAQVLFIPTNNATFGKTSETWQQLAISRFRAVETGRNVVQVSTVGISAVINVNGSIRKSTGHFEAAQIVSDVQLKEEISPAVTLGQFPVYLASFTVVVLVLVGICYQSGNFRDQRRSRKAEK